MENITEGKVSKQQTSKLIKLMEECGELTQAAAKVLRHGWGVTKDGKNRKKALIDEMGDVYAVMAILQDDKDVDCDSVDERVYNKYHILSPILNEK